MLIDCFFNRLLCSNFLCRKQIGIYFTVHIYLGGINKFTNETVVWEDSVNIESINKLFIGQVVEKVDNRLTFIFSSVIFYKCVLK